MSYKVEYLKGEIWIETDFADRHIYEKYLSRQTLIRNKTYFSQNYFFDGTWLTGFEYHYPSDNMGELIIRYMQSISCESWIIFATKSLALKYNWLTQDQINLIELFK